MNASHPIASSGSPPVPDVLRLVARPQGGRVLSPRRALIHRGERIGCALPVSFRGPPERARRSLVLIRRGFEPASLRRVDDRSFNLLHQRLQRSRPR